MSDLNVYTTSQINALTPITGDMVVDSDLNAIKLYDGAAWRTWNSDSTAVPYYNRWGVSFDGSSDYLDCGNLTAINSIANCSYSFWYKQVNSGLSVLMGNIDNKVGAYHWSDGNAYFRIANRVHTIVGSPTLNQWHHVAMTFDGSVTTSKFYLDGVYKSIATNEASTTWFQAGTRFYIGRGFATGYGSPLIDEFSIFTTTLSDGGGLSIGDTAGGDIEDIYNSGVPNNIGTSGLNLNPVGWWRMGDDSNDSPVAGGNITGITNTANPGTNDATQSTASSQPSFSALASSESIYV